jgi:predicted O-methyltransferase YrrM
MKEKLRNFYNRYILKYFTQINETQQDTLAMQYLTPFSKTYVPWSDSAMRPSAIVTVLNDILINKRRCIVECGGGISTFYIARLLKERGGHLYTIEHEEIWGNFLNEKLKEENLDNFVSVIVAPLQPTELGIDGNNWYDVRVLNQQLTTQSIDMLLVDGPPAYQTKFKYARYPAVPYFYRFMQKSDYTIILDDINREGEQNIVTKWEKYLNIRFERRLLKGNIALGTANPLLTV